jgi:hypothetical protein
VADAVLADAFPEAPAEDPPAAAGTDEPAVLSSSQLARWEGLYRTPDEPNYWRFEVRSGRLHILAPSGPIPLVPLSEVRFVMEGPGAPVVFQSETAEWPEGVRVGSTVFLRREPAELSASDRRSLSGSYWSPELGVRFEVSARDGALWLARPGREPEPFLPGIEDEFEVGGVAVVVLRRPDRSIEGLELHAGRVTGLVFEREAR